MVAGERRLSSFDHPLPHATDLHRAFNDLDGPSSNLFSFSPC